MGNYSIEFVLEIIKGDIECGFKTAHEAIGEVIEAYEIRDRRIAQKIRERVEAREANFASTLCDRLFESGKLTMNTPESYGLKEFVCQRVGGQLTAREFNTLVLGWLADQELMDKYEGQFLPLAEVLVSAPIKHVEVVK